MNRLRDDLRRTTFRQASGALAASLVLALASTVGCGLGLSAATVGGFEPAVDAGAVTAAADAGATVDAARLSMPIAVDGGAGMGSDTHIANVSGASPLCGSASGCSPDDPTSCSDVDAGVRTQTDGGEPSTMSLSCHVTSTGYDAGVARVCSAAGNGGVESPCRHSADCRAGFECVVSDAKAAGDGAPADGVCRHYCCDNTCSEPRSFCDIEPTVGGGAEVPVCVSKPPAPALGDGGAMCQLLDDATCSNGLSCQVVNQNTGEVACITPGSATANQSCETTNCAPGFSCILGYFPNRECAKLCNHENDCPSTETCTPNAALSNVNSQVGICTQ